MTAFHHLVVMRVRILWVGFFGEAYGCSLSPMLVCGSLGMIILHSKHDQTIITKRTEWEDSPERVGVRNRNGIVGSRSSYQTVVHHGKSEDRRNRHDQNYGLKKTRHDSGS